MSKELVRSDTIKAKHEYGFKIGGMDEDEKNFYNTMAYWNNSDKIYKLIVTDSMTAGQDIQTFLQAL